MMKDLSDHIVRHGEFQQCRTTNVDAHAAVPWMTGMQRLAMPLASAIRCG